MGARIFARVSNHEAESLVTRKSALLGMRQNRWLLRACRRIAAGDNAKHFSAADGAIRRQPGKISEAGNGLVEQRAVAPPRHFRRAECSQMLGHELGVEQHEAP